MFDGLSYNVLLLESMVKKSYPIDNWIDERWTRLDDKVIMKVNMCATLCV